MVAYIIVDIDVTSPDAYEEYKRLAAPTVVAHGGQYIVRGGNPQVLEGDWQPSRIVVLQFDTVEQAKAWWSSEIYTPLKEIRHSTTNSNMILVEGV